MTEHELAPGVPSEAEPDPPAHGRPFVPAGFLPPVGLVADEFLLEPLGSQHNEGDYDAWTSSIDHIHATPGFDPETAGGDRWPYPMTRADNLADLVMHADHFDRHVGFTYTILDPVTRDVIGCLYIYPDSVNPDVDARVRSWVRQSRASLDATVAASVESWLNDSWPFRRVRYR